MGKTSIEWTRGEDGSEGKTWNPTRGCSRVSPGCVHCYAERIAARFSQAPDYEPPGDGDLFGKIQKAGKFNGFVRIANGHPQWTGKVELIESKLMEPLHWCKPCRIFVNSMSDLFHEALPDEAIDRIFAVMALCPQHTFQVLTKRPGRMLTYCSEVRTPFRIAKQMDVVSVAQEMTHVTEEIRPIESYPGYFISNLGFVLSSHGSSECLYCGKPVDGIATKSYCSKQCKQNACYHRRVGHEPRFAGKLVRMSPDEGDQGHQRVMLYKDGVQYRELVHRLVLTAFDRPAVAEEQGCHRDGNATNNHIANLRWGTQGDNWEDSKRHGNHRRYSKLTESDVSEIRRRHSRGETGEALAHHFGVSATQVRNIARGRQGNMDAPIEWPLVNCWAGCSVEDQARKDRIDVLRETPAAIRFLSIEPLLEDIGELDLRGISQVIVGGESGPGARPFHWEWAEAVRDQCRTAGTSFFMKQGGSNCFDGEDPWIMSDSKGGHIEDFPSNLRVREFPA